MSKTVRELLEQHAGARSELLKKIGLGGEGEDRIHILDRQRVPWVFSTPRGTIWCAPTLPKSDMSEEALTAWVHKEATHFSPLFNADTNKPAMWEIDGVIAVLFAYRHSSDLFVLMLLDPALRGEDSVGHRIHKIACAGEALAKQEHLALFGLSDLSDLVEPMMPDHDDKGILH
jgi:hypothetical protein